MATISRWPRGKYYWCCQEQAERSKNWWNCSLILRPFQPLVQSVPSSSAALEITRSQSSLALSLTNYRVDQVLAVAVVGLAAASIQCLAQTNAAGARSRYSSNRTAANASTSCDMRLLDECGATLMVFGQRSVYLPVNQKEMAPHCDGEYDAEACIKSFARRCLNPFERQIVGMICLGAGQVLRTRCAPEGTKEYLTHHKCIANSISLLHDAMDQLINTLTIVSLRSGQKALDVPCCAFSRYTEYSTRLVRNACQDFDPSAADYIGTKMIKGYSAEVLELVCPGFEHKSDKCRKVSVPSGGFEWKNNTLVAVRSLEKLARKPESIISPFLSIMKSQA